MRTRILMQAQILTRALILTLMLALALGACTVGMPAGGSGKSPAPADGNGSGSQAKPDTFKPVTAVNLLAGLTAPSGSPVQQGGESSGSAVDPNADTDATSALDAVNAFSWKLYNEILAESGSGNAMVSPLSVHLALDMALNGAAGETAAEMQRALAADGITLDALNAGMRQWLETLSVEGAAKWSVANSIWVDSRYDVSKAFLEKGALNYLADAWTLDFTNPETVDEINGWVKDRTNGKIDGILDKIGEDVRMYLINAVWFKADWEKPFTQASTMPGTFHASAGDIETPFMHTTGGMTTLDPRGAGEAASKIAAGILMPYTDERFTFVALLPAEGTTAREMAAALDQTTFASLLASRLEEQVELALPKFETRYETELTTAMQALGMKSAFEASSADFSGISAGGAKELFISAIRHKTYIRVDEKGTEAAAATSVEMSLTSMPVIERQISFDRPFLYAVLDAQNGMPLFMGVMENPAE